MSHCLECNHEDPTIWDEYWLGYFCSTECQKEYDDRFEHWCIGSTVAHPVERTDDKE